MNTFTALIKREILDGMNGYIRVPAILAALSVFLVIVSTIGFGATIEFDGVFDRHPEVSNLGEAVEMAANSDKGEHELPAAVTLSYWVMGGISWVALPFVIFFSLLSSLYEERRDRSILFWKSMPVADWQEVLAKLVTPVVVAPLVFLGVAVAAQLLIAFFLSIVVLFQGGPVLEMWPLATMLGTWAVFVTQYAVSTLWVLPLLAWVLFVSSYASRLPFMWAVLPPAVIAAVEGILFETTRFLEWFGVHLGGWQAYAYHDLNPDIDGPRDFLNLVFGGVQMEGLTYTLSSGQFWLGLVIAGGFVYGAIEMRKRAI
ncbi:MULTISPECIES: hypothetical protein [Kordiimonas]|jgi:ABC-2 type transport system permease protein|uniref:hypothetical protein n=1 Tax=Kordiimonas TaxID=288021 RepID=UPI00257B03F7|nr:hypothetical protein [Kordiimonas sp. UBA4487]